MRVVMKGRVVAAVLLLTLSGCAGGSEPSSDVTTEAEAEFAVQETLRDIEEIYYKETKASLLVAAGLERVQESYPGVRFAWEGDTMIATVGSQQVFSFKSGQDKGDADYWSGRIAATLTRIEQASAPEEAKSLSALTDAFLRGATDSLDGRSCYVSPDDGKQLHRREGGREGTLDIVLEPADGGWKIANLFSVQLLHSGELRRGDLVVAVNGIPTAGLSEAAVTKLTTGPLGSFVNLTVQRDDGAGPHEVTLELKKWKSESVRTEMIDKSAVIALTRLDDEAVNEVRYQTARVSSQDGGNNLVILDLRGNGGGILDASIATADLFLKKGRILSTQGRHAGSHQIFDASDVPALDAPLIVLVDEFTAAGAEIVVAALQDNARAVVVGSTTYGRGTIQTALPMPNSSFLALSWAEVITPAGYRLDQRGVMPAICTGGTVTSQEVLAAMHSGGGVTSYATRTKDIDPEDTVAVAAFRALCPPREDGADVSLQVARALLADPELFTQVLAAVGQ